MTREIKSSHKTGGRKCRPRQNACAPGTFFPVFPLLGKAETTLAENATRPPSRPVRTPLFPFTSILDPGYLLYAWAMFELKLSQGLPRQSPASSKERSGSLRQSQELVRQPCKGH